MAAMTLDTARDVELDGVPTRYWDAGEGPALLLIHGAGPGADSILFWETIFDTLTEQFRVIAPDAPGYGGTDLLPERDTPENVARHFGKLLDHLDISEVLVIGHSRGGRVAAEFAAAFPDRVSKLCIICSGSTAPMGHVGTDGGWTAPTRAIIDFGTDGDTSYEKFKAAYEGGILIDPVVWPEEMLRSTYDRLMSNPNRLDEWLERMKGDSYLMFYHYEDAERFEAKLRNLPMPTMVLVGRDDETATWDKSVPLIGMIPRVEAYFLSQLGHFPQLERPSAFLALLLGFLNRVSEPWDFAAATTGAAGTARDPR